MVERPPGVIPPRPGPPPRQRPSRARIVTRRALALLALLSGLAALGWLGVSVLTGNSRPLASTQATRTDLLTETVTRTTATSTTSTVILVEKPLRIVFPEGFTRRDMAARIAAVDRIAEQRRHLRPALSTRQYLAATARSALPGSFAGDGKHRDLEGFLFPATYDFGPTTTSAQLVQQQLSSFRQNWSTVDLGYARSKQLTPYDVLIIASMVEKEALAPDDRPKIAAVIYNRLHDHMPLGIDATIRYALNVPGTKSLLESELHNPTPFNTRLYQGLPPTPIANPGLASMQAAAHPAHVNYLYFVRGPDKVHHFFTASYQAFLNYERTHGY